MVKINQNVELVDSFFQSKISKLLINGVDEKISSFILNDFNLDEIKSYLKTIDFKTLLDDGKRKVQEEETTLKQVYKVVNFR